MTKMDITEEILYGLLGLHYMSPIDKTFNEKSISIYNAKERVSFTYDKMEKEFWFSQRQDRWLFTNKGVGCTCVLTDHPENPVRIPAGGTYYWNFCTVKRIQHIEEIYHRVMHYFYKFLIQPKGALVNGKEVYHHPLKDIFSPICQFMYRKPIMMCYYEPSSCFPDVCVKLSNEETNASFSESFGGLDVVVFSDDEGNRWFYNQYGSVSFASITENGFEKETCEKGHVYIDEETGRRTVITTRKEVYKRACDYFFKFIVKKNFKKYKRNLFKVSNN